MSKDKSKGRTIIMRKYNRQIPFGDSWQKVWCQPVWRLQGWVDVFPHHLSRVSSGLPYVGQRKTTTVKSQCRVTWDERLAAYLQSRTSTFPLNQVLQQAYPEEEYSLRDCKFIHNGCDQPSVVVNQEIQNVRLKSLNHPKYQPREPRCNISKAGPENGDNLRKGS